MIKILEGKLINISIKIDLVRGIVDHHIDAGKGVVLTRQIFHIAHLKLAKYRIFQR